MAKNKKEKPPEGAKKAPWLEPDASEPAAFMETPIRSHLLWLLALGLFAGGSLNGYFLAEGGLCAENLLLWREIPLIGGANPFLFTLFSGFALPLALSLGLLLLFRLLFKRTHTIILLLAICAFSPAATAATGDFRCMLDAALAAHLAAASVYFAKTRSQKGFLLLGLALASCAALMNPLAFAFTAAFFLCAAALISLALKKPPLSLFSGAPALHWTALALLCAAISGALASVFATAGGFAPLRAANPLEILAISTIGVGVVSGGPLLPFPAEAQGLSYSYMGALALPLCAVGVICSGKKTRAALLALLGLLAAVSLTFFLPQLLAALPKLTKTSYGGTLFGAGGFIIVSVCAGYGIEALLEGDKKKARVLAACFAASMAATALLFAVSYANAPFHPAPNAPKNIFGFGVLMALLYAVALGWLSKARGESQAKKVFAFIIALCLVDVSTAASWHVRQVQWPSMKKAASSGGGEKAAQTAFLMKTGGGAP